MYAPTLQYQHPMHSVLVNPARSSGHAARTARRRYRDHSTSFSIPTAESVTLCSYRAAQAVGRQLRMELV